MLDLPLIRFSSVNYIDALANPRLGLNSAAAPQLVSWRDFLKLSKIRSDLPYGNPADADDLF
jgi:hypothetical protein